MRFGSPTVTLNGTYSFPNFVAALGTYTFNGPVTATDSVVISGSSVTFNSTLTPPSYLRLNNGTLRGSADISVIDSLIFTRGGLNTTGTTTIASGDLMRMSGGFDKSFQSGTINNSGTIVWSGGFLRGGTLNNLEGGTFDVQAANTFLANTTFNNAGTMTKTGAGLAGFNVPFINTSTGTIDIQSDTLRFPRDGSILAGAINVPIGTTLWLSDGTITIDTSLVGAGTVRFSFGPAVTVNGTYSFPQLHVETGTVTFNGPVTAPGGIITTGAVTFDSAVSTTDSLIVGASTATFNSTVGTPGFIRLSGTGAIAGTANISVGDSLVWTGGSLSSSGTTTIGASAEVPMSSTSSKGIRNGTISNFGSILWSGGGLYSVDNGSLTNMAGGTMEMQGALTFIQQTGAGTFSNAGTLTKTGTGISALDILFTNTGTVDAQAGTNRLANAYLPKAHSVLHHY